jgi:hypothetical protein
MMSEIEFFRLESGLSAFDVVDGSPPPTCDNRRPATKVAAVALANKTARMVWALMTSGERYREPVVQA